MIPKRWANRAVLSGWRWASRTGEIVPGTVRPRSSAPSGGGSSIGFPPATLMGTRAIHIGNGTLIVRQATLSVGYGPTDPNLPERGLVIGDRSAPGLGHGRCACVVEIGDAVWFGQDVFVTDSGHGYQDPELPIGEQFGAQLPVVIGSGSWIGTARSSCPARRSAERRGRSGVVRARWPTTPSSAAPPRS